MSEQHAAPVDAEPTLPPLPAIDHIALPVRDMPRAVAFYTRLLGLRLTDHRDPASSSYIWVSFGSEDAPGSLNLSRVSEVGAPIHFGWQAEPALRDAYAAKLEAAGVAVRRTATSVYFLDPDGNELEITSWRWARG